MSELIIFVLMLGINDPFHIKCDLEFEADGIIALDFDDDQCCDLLRIRDNHYYLTDQKLISRFQLNPRGPRSYLACTDIDGIAGKEMLFAAFESGILFLEVFSSGKEFSRHELLHDLPEAWDGMLSACKASDLNDDGNQDLICLVGSNFSLQPRGILVYDHARNRELWHFWMGVSPRDLHLLDIDRDGKEEIIISTTAVANGSSVNGFDDRNSYVICFDTRGAVKWSRIIGNTFTDAVTWVGDIDDDGNIEIVVVEAEGRADRVEPNRICILNAADGSVKRYIVSGGKHMDLVVCDLDRNDTREIIVGNIDGFVRVYDFDLYCMNERLFDGRIDIKSAVDIDGDGYLELLVTINNNRLLVLNERLETVGE
ncbi:hypothetical protein A2Y85_02210 [candidate division WOR-3 bacterium RBG_13_43_14]|uniref:VCBS repeat-containing protein n=1 Tax=candidate division WOR-3 bacterium RBG_13_43_14 TaxID=1802590 RepID=A0A1F4UDG7_UNCW3|nr:MAG: hypothetical protein A2Y85_02210 [candidate division WOR-3 bacterium RBG_13_43_14]